jgi:O-antigen biosynthesis protein
MRPRASVIILVQKHPENIIACLQSLRANSGPETSYESLVVFNGAEPDVIEAVENACFNARFFAFDVNLGFGGGCNYGAFEAQGQYLIFLNDDTVVEPGWLPALVATADEHPEAGAVGSKILFLDRTVQEAGAIIWSDGSTMPVGRGLGADARAFHYVREVDYCSANALLVKRDIFDSVGGFDEGYYPAYYEDVDLCLAIRKAGYSVIYEPRSRIRHIEAASSESGYRSFLFRRNRRRLQAKWQDDLAQLVDSHAPCAEALAVERAQPYRQSILVVDDRLPNAAIGSGFGLMHELLLDLADKPFAVTFYPSTTYDGDIDTLAGLRVALFDESLETHLRRPDVQFSTVVFARPHNYKRFGHLVRMVQPQAKILYNVEALFYRRLITEAANTADNLLRIQYTREADQMVEAEREIVRDADHVVCIADEELDICRSWRDGGVELLRPIQRNIAATSTPFDKRRDIVFVAGWLAGPRSPNVSALQWFAANVLPLVIYAVPGIRLKVAGAEPPVEARNIDSSYIDFLGFVPKIADLYGGALVAIAPILFGAGVKIKALESMQHGGPVVATRIGAEGLGDDIHSVIDVTDDAEEFADRIVALVNDAALWNQRRDSIANYLSFLEKSARRSWVDILIETLDGEQYGESRLPARHRT